MLWTKPENRHSAKCPDETLNCIAFVILARATNKRECVVMSKSIQKLADPATSSFLV
jgi:hypothetical protein